jgi:hypothetical protein
MKKIILSIIITGLLHQGFGQLNIGTGAQWITTSNPTVVLQDVNLVNNGTIAGGAGSFKFMGAQNSSISGTNMPSFYIVEIAKTVDTKVLLDRNINASSSVIFISGQLDLNGNNILLSTGANIAGETETNRIIGANGGFIEITQNLNSPNGNNPGNLGASITSLANLGAVTIRRGHTAQSGTGLATSIHRYYDIIATNNSDLNATLRLKYFDAELNAQTESGLVIYQSNDGGSGWTNISQTSRSTNANYVEKTGINSLSLQTLANDVPAANGVTGLILTGQRKKPTEITLKWLSQTETNMSGYLIQRRLDTEPDFSDGALINTIAAGGSSISPLNYQHIDPNPHAGNSYYRLKIITTDNSFTYSNEIAVPGKAKGSSGGGNGNNRSADDLTMVNGKPMMQTGSIARKITIGPNPNNGNFWFSVNGIEKETIATLYTLDGKQIQQFRIVNLQRQQVNGLRTGLYVLKIPGLDAQKIVVNAGGNLAPSSTPAINTDLKF